MLWLCAQKEEEELPLEVGASVILPEEQDGGSWSVEPEISPSEGTGKSAEGEGKPASWMKVSVVSAASVRKKEVLPTWTGSSGAGGREEGGGGEEEEEGTSRGAGAPEDGGEARSSETETGGAATGSNKEEEGKRGGGGGGGEEEAGKGLRGLDALLNSVSSGGGGGGGDAGKKYMLPSLRARLSGSGSSSSYRGSSGKPNFDDDQDLNTVAQLGLYRTPGVSMQDAAAALKKKKLQQQQQGENSPVAAAGEENATAAEGAGASAEKKKKKKKATADTPEDSTCLEGRRRADEESSTGGGTATPADTSPKEIFNVWKYVHLGDELLNNCSAAQNNELVKEKYIRRKRWGEQTTHLEPQTVA